MVRPIFEHYKATLKAGHIALLRGHLDEAEARYREAAALADERPTPHAGLAAVLFRQGRLEAALAAYGRALERGPGDEAALRGRAVALIAARRAEEAATDLERLAQVLAAAGHRGDAASALRRARELVATPHRRLRADALLVALGPVDDAGDWTRAVPAPPPATFAKSAAPLRAPPLPAPGPTPPPAPADPESLVLEAEAALASGAAAQAVTGFVAASRRFAGEGQPEAALEACGRALLVDPDSAPVQLELARLYFERGWHDRAVEKLLLLDRLLDLSADLHARQDLRALAAERAFADPRLGPLWSVALDESGPAAAVEAPGQ